MSSRVSGSIPSNPTPQLQVVLDYLTAVCEGDFSKMTTFLTDDFMHHVHPRSLGIPSSDKAAWTQFNVNIYPFFEGFKLQIYEIVEGGNTVSLHASSSSTTTSGAHYNNEYALFFELVAAAEGSLQIRRQKEFVNSKYASEFFLAEKARQEAAGHKFPM
ncbi:hypothetical protein QCA50_014390 [Cerrena zonata]|uniref:SnoaL-like domain-containing protein n=1 Tax=Cerrena zonata TaxID=2478898 RepID=A0AAW0FMM3_9APHY